MAMPVVSLHRQTAFVTTRTSSALTTRLSSSLVLALGLPLYALSQGTVNNPNQLLGQDKYRAITTAVPFLTITPDARTGGVGDQSSALSPDNNAIQFNAAKLAFAEKRGGAGISITPWLRNLGVTDMYLALLSGYYKPRKQDAISVGFTYFSLGSIQFTDADGNPVRDFNPQEFSVAAAYSRQLTSKFALGVTGKFVYSNLTGNFSNNNAINARPGTTAAVDISGYYHTDFALGGTPAQLVLAGAINNFGPKISYSDNNRRDFIPTTVRFSPAITLTLDPYNKLTILAEASKLAVPTPNPLRDTATGSPITPSDKNLLSGFFSSFTDAPDGTKEELQEVMLSGGVEYWYDNLFALRGGYFNEAANKGNRKYFTAGVGLRYQAFGLDISYLIPSTAGAQSPLANTLRFSLIFNIDGGQKQEESVTE